MRIRTLRILLWTFGAICIVGSAALSWLSLWLPLENGAAPSPSVIQSREAELGERAAIPITEIERIAGIDLRKPLYDAPAPVVPAEPPPPLALKLAGTIIEPGHSRAVLVGPEGKVELKSVGESLAGAQVLQISPQAVTVRYLEREVELKLQRENAGK